MQEELEQLTETKQGSRAKLRECSQQQQALHADIEAQRQAIAANTRQTEHLERQNAGLQVGLFSIHQL